MRAHGCVDLLPQCENGEGVVVRMGETVRRMSGRRPKVVSTAVRATARWVVRV